MPATEEFSDRAERRAVFDRVVELRFIRPVIDESVEVLPVAEGAFDLGVGKIAIGFDVLQFRNPGGPDERGKACLDGRACAVLELVRLLDDFKAHPGRGKPAERAFAVVPRAKFFCGRVDDGCADECFVFHGALAFFFVEFYNAHLAFFGR